MILNNQIPQKSEIGMTLRNKTNHKVTKSITGKYNSKIEQENRTGK